MKQVLSYLSKTRILSLTDQMLVSGGNFVTTMLGVRLLSAENLGKYGYILSAYMAVSVLNQVLIYQESSIEAPRSPKSYFSKINLLQLLFAIILSTTAGFSLLGIGLSSGWMMSSIQLFWIILFLFFQQQVDFVRRGSYIFSNVGISVVVSLLVYPIRLAALLLFRPHEIISFTIVLGLTALIPSIKPITDVFMRKYELTGFCQFFIDHIIKIKWLILAGPLTWLWSNIPLFVLGVRGDLIQVGVYTTLNSITNVGNVFMELLETIISASAGRLYYKNSNEQALNQLIQQTFWVGFTLWLLIFLLLFFTGRFLVHILTNEVFSAHYELMYVMWFDIIFVFLYRLSSLRIRTIGKTHVIFLSLVVCCIVSGIFSFILIPYYGAFGAAIVVGVAACAMWLSQIILIKTGI